MNLNFGENLKKLRRSHDMTQEELAEALGLSIQAISRYETQAAYPDIEMLPVIAGYFGVTVDSLLGVSGEAKERRRNEYSAKANIEENPEKRLEIIKKWYSEFPDDWDAVASAMFTIGQMPKDKQDLPALRKLAKKSVSRCTDRLWHGHLIHTYLNAEPDESTAIKFIDENYYEYDMSKLNLMTNYYERRDEAKTRALYQNIYQGKISEAVHFLTLFRYGGDVRDAIESCKLALDFLTRLSGNPCVTKPDMWIEDKLWALLRLSNNYLFFDERVEGFKALDSAVTLIENALSLPDGTDISFGSPKFNMLEAATQKTVHVTLMNDTLSAVHGFALAMNIKSFPIDKALLSGDCEKLVMRASVFLTIIAEPDWRNFSRYENDPEYQKYVKRIKAAVDLSKCKNIEYAFTTGMINNPEGRLLAAATEDKDNLRWVYIFSEVNGDCFAAALEKFKEAAGIYKISKATPLLAVDKSRKVIPIPEDVADWFAAGSFGGQQIG